MKKLLFIQLVMFTVFSYQAIAQKKSNVRKPNPQLILADKYFNERTYYLSAGEYAAVLKKDSSNAYAMYQLAECLRVQGEYTKAEHLYKKVTERFRDKYPIARFYYAKMLKRRGDCANAIKQFEQYILERLDSDYETEHGKYLALMEIEGCKFVALDKQIPKKDYQLKALSRSINTSGTEYSPTFFENDTTILISVSKGENEDGALASSWFPKDSEMKCLRKSNDSTWTMVKNGPGSLEELNTEFADLPGSFTAEGKKFYFTRCDEKDEWSEYNCAIYVTAQENGIWTKPVKLNEEINPPGTWNAQPCVSYDGKILFFVSTRPGGLGLKDIWCSVSEGDDRWRKALNLGDKVNTLYNDLSPHYYLDQKVLFFSSDGHPGYGGVDIFMTIDEGDFQEITNIGAPFNSPADDLDFNMGEKKGYFISDRKGGQGKYDIYSFTIPSVTKVCTNVKVIVDSLEMERKKNFYALSFNPMFGGPVDSSKLKGKKVLIVNTASKASLSHFEELEKLHKEYGDKVVVMGCPCDQFGEEFADEVSLVPFRKNYGLTYIMLRGRRVSGTQQSPLYEWLTTKALNGWNDQAPTANFFKYLISEDGKLLGVYDPSVSVFDEKILGQIKK